MLGSALAPFLLEDNYQVIPTDINAQANEKLVFLDVCDASSVFRTIEEQNPDIVMHLAAETDVDRCEVDPDRAYKTNAIGTQNIALACQRFNIIMVYVSTGAVFDGSKFEPYTEFDDPKPINTYGKTKLAGERIVQNLLHKYYIVRAGWMMGGGAKDKKFIAKIVDLLKTTKELKVVADKFGSPTYTVDFSKGLMQLIKTEYFGLYHLSNKGSCSRYDIANELLKIMERDDVQLTPVNSAYFPCPAPRPRSEMLRNYKLDLLGITEMRPWEEALRDYVELNFKNNK